MLILCKWCHNAASRCSFREPDIGKAQSWTRSMSRFHMKLQKECTLLRWTWPDQDIGQLPRVKRASTSSVTTETTIISESAHILFCLISWCSWDRPGFWRPKIVMILHHKLLKRRHAYHLREPHPYPTFPQCQTSARQPESACWPSCMKVKISRKKTQYWWRLQILRYHVHQWHEANGTGTNQAASFSGNRPAPAVWTKQDPAIISNSRPADDLILQEDWDLWEIPVWSQVFAIYQDELRAALSGLLDTHQLGHASLSGHIIWSDNEILLCHRCSTYIPISLPTWLQSMAQHASRTRRLHARRLTERTSQVSVTAPLTGLLYAGSNVQIASTV